MKLDFHSDDSHDHFQFLWLALARAPLRAMGPGRVAVLAGLMERLSDVSQESNGGGRTLIEPCELLVTEVEHKLILEAIASTPWRPEVKGQVLGLAQFIQGVGR